MKHSRLILFGITKKHRIVKEEKKILSVDFEVKNKDRSELKVSGKRKCKTGDEIEGSEVVEAKTIICEVDIGEERKIKVRAGVKGRLIEVNERLKQSPELLQQDPEGEGFIGIIMVGADKLEKELSFLTREYDA